MEKEHFEQIRDFYKTSAGKRMYPTGKRPFLLHDGSSVYSPVDGKIIGDMPGAIWGDGDIKLGIGEVLKSDLAHLPLNSAA